MDIRSATQESYPRNHAEPRTAQRRKIREAVKDELPAILHRRRQYDSGAGLPGMSSAEPFYHPERGVIWEDIVFRQSGVLP